MNLYDLIWAARPLLVFLSREEFFAELDEWGIEALTVDGKAAFALKTRGPEFQLVDLKTGAAFPMEDFRRRLGQMLEVHGYVTTRAQKWELEDISLLVELEDVKATGSRHRFLRGMGFSRTGEDQYDVHYRLSREAFLQGRQSADLH